MTGLEIQLLIINANSSRTCMASPRQSHFNFKIWLTRKRMVSGFRRNLYYNGSKNTVGICTITAWPVWSSRNITFFCDW